MATIWLTLIIFLEILQYLVFFDVILSWLTLLGIQFRPKFLSDVLRPIYSFVKRYIPTSFGAFDFTPIVVIFGLMFLRGLVIIVFPGAEAALSNLVN